MTDKQIEIVRDLEVMEDGHALVTFTVDPNGTSALRVHRRFTVPGVEGLTQQTFLIGPRGSINMLVAS